jgi:hypothetical protein
MKRFAKYEKASNAKFNPNSSILANSSVLANATVTAESEITPLATVGAPNESTKGTGIFQCDKNSLSLEICTNPNALLRSSYWNRLFFDQIFKFILIVKTFLSFRYLVEG